MWLQVDLSVTEKAVDCLRILTTGNEANKVALLTSASGLPCLVRLMEQSPDQASGSHSLIQKSVIAFTKMLNS